jgi:diguanylate cyclase (GGDEF)-like protein
MLASAKFNSMFHGIWLRAASRLAPWFPLGITARLSISFTAVAILAAAANLIVEQGVSIVRSTHLEPAAQSPPPAGTSAPPAIDVSTEPHPAWQMGVKSERFDVLRLAINQFERAVQGRAEINSTDTTARFQEASQELEWASANVLAEATSVSGAPIPKFAASVKAYKKRGEELLRLTDARRVVLSNYSTHFEAMNTRMKTSLDGAWKIFGRVLARQSLMQLRTNLDEIRRRFASINSTDTYDAAAIAALVASEAAFAKTFKNREESFSRSEGPYWVQQMREDFSQIVALRSMLVKLDAQRRASALEFLKEGATLANMIPRRVIRRAGPPQANDIGTPSRATTISRTLPASVAAVTTTATVPRDNGRRTLVAWITAGVLLLLTAISVFTMRSIVRPVSRMLKATAQLARGQLDARVPRGGIKELDTLAVAFNRMAEQLAAAREMTRGYQQQLEAKVEERTRQLQRLAEQDPLTLLPNRRQLFALLNTGIERAAKDQRYVGVFFLDIDNFKNLNDSMGHAFGDRVLMSVAQRLDETARSFGFAARLGGDEFTLVYEDAPSADAVRDAGWNLVQAFHKPITVDERELIVSVSVGASVYPDHEHGAEGLLSAADAALFRAKALGRSQLAVFTPELLETAASKFTTEQGLRRAIERGEFELVYQPEVSLDTLEIALVEALLRWRLSDGRLVSPGEFLAVTEESGLIMEISDWVLRTAIETTSRWHHGAWPEARVAINVSPRQLVDQRFVERVQELLQEFRLPPRCIEIELTETVLQTGPATIETLRRLRAYGIAIALDDFGTGYSSLASLEQLPLTRIKLDRSLIASIDTSARSAAIARAIIGLCNSLGLEVTAEGVERPEQFACLLGNRAMFLQGYLLSRPVSSEELLPVKASIGQLMRDLLLSVPAKSYSSDVVEISSVTQRTLPKVGRP